VPTILWQFGGGVVNEDVTQATLNSPESVAAMQFLKDLSCEYHVMNPYQTGVPFGGEAYQNNQIAIWWEGTWTGGYMRDRPEVAAVTQPMALNSLAPDGNQVVKFDSHVFSVPTGVDDTGREQAYAMVQFLLENGAYWATSGQVPALESVQALPEVQEIESVATAAEQFNQFGRTDTAHPAFIEIQTAWETAVGNAMATCDASVEQALNDGNTAIQAILDRP
jgi:multiple sugar transport system substrate-binding protein